MAPVTFKGSFGGCDGSGKPDAAAERGLRDGPTTASPHRDYQSNDGESPCPLRAWCGPRLERVPREVGRDERR